MTPRRTAALLALAALSCRNPAGPTAAGPSGAAPPLAADAAPSGAPAPAPADDAARRAADVKFLTDLAETRSYRLGLPVSPTPLADGKTVLFLRARAREANLSLYAFDAESGATRELLTPEQVLKGAEEKLSPEERARRERMRVSTRGFTAYEPSADGKTVLLILSGRVYALTLATGEVRELAGPDAAGEPPFDARLSPDGTRVGFVRAGELWVAPVAGGAAKQVTRDAKGDVTHAQAEFVAQEEMDRFTGWWWSPDSKRLVYEIADAAKVERVYLQDPGDPMQAPEIGPYPRPGKANVVVSLGIIAAGGGKTTLVDWDRERYPYLADVVWEEGGPLTLIVQSRDQKDLSLLACDAKTGKTRELLHERDDAWVNLRAPGYEWLRDGAGFLWATERGGAWQLELRAPDGALVRTLTEPGFGLRKLVHVDLAARQVYVTAAAEAVDQHVFAVPLDGGAPRQLTQGDGVYDAAFGRADALYVQSEMRLDAVVLPEVRRPTGEVVGRLPGVSEAPPFVPRVEIAKVGAEPGFWTSMVRPRDFDPRRKYPVLVYVYGGPGVTVVHRNIAMYLEQQWVADHGYLVVAIDNRGTPRRGRAWERAILHRFAEVPLEDQVAGLQALAAGEPAMDLSRVGIFGASFGGYMAALAVLRRPDVFHAAAAVAPVTDWMDYDTHYTERYLGVPTAEDHAIYDQNGLIARAADLERPLLLVHGTVDDNVHFRHTLELADALFRAGKTFELLPMVGETHISKVPALRMRYWEREFAFFEEHLR